MDSAVNTAQEAAACGSPQTPSDVRALMRQMGCAAVAAAEELARASSVAKNRAISDAVAALRRSTSAILAANVEDVDEAKRQGIGAAVLDRLRLDANRVEAMARGLEQVIELPDPIGTVIAEWERPNGLRNARVRVPLGVIGIIYESRPNVTADAGALCLKSGNASILRGGSESRRSNAAIHACLTEGLSAVSLPTAAIQLVPTTDRAAVGEMLAHMQEYIDVLVPRGGKSLVARVQQDKARLPVIGHLERPTATCTYRSRRGSGDGASNHAQFQDASHRHLWRR